MTLSYFCLKSTIEYITSMLLDSKCISDSKQSNKSKRLYLCSVRKFSFFLFITFVQSKQTLDY